MEKIFFFSKLEKLLLKTKSFPKNQNKTQQDTNGFLGISIFSFSFFSSFFDFLNRFSFFSSRQVVKQKEMLTSGAKNSNNYETFRHSGSFKLRFFKKNREYLFFYFVFSQKFFFFFFLAL